MGPHETADPEPLNESTILASTEPRGDKTLGEIATEFREGILTGQEADPDGLTTKELLKVMIGALKTRIQDATYLRRRSEP